jgi:Leucine-rich repeat (LRR) protein
LIVYACIRVNNLNNNAESQRIIFITHNKNIKLEKITLPSKLKTIEIPFDVKEVTHLYLYNIGLKSIPDNINEYSNLKYLDISLNYIEDLKIQKLKKKKKKK